MLSVFERTTSPNLYSFHSFIELHLPEVLDDKDIQPRLFLQLLLKRGLQLGEPLFKIEIVLVLRQSYITARVENVVEPRTRSIEAELQNPFTSS